MSSLAALAAGIDGAGSRLPLIDARRGEVFAALYEGERASAGRRSRPRRRRWRERVRGGGSAPAGGRGRLGTIPGRPRGGAASRVGPAGSRAHVVRGAARLPAGARRAARGRRRRCFPTTCESPTPSPDRMTEPLEIRRLTYADLPQVIAIERRAFPTPWSLAMFVLELSKPSGICLAALRDGRLVGYLVCSRYDTVWHLMNVAVDDRLLPRRASPPRCSSACSTQADAPGRAVHARGAHLERRGDRALRAASASARPAAGAATTTTTARTP